MRLSPPALFGAAAIALASAGAAWFALGRGDGPAEEVLPTPPEPPRLVDSPEYDRCLALLATDAQDALTHAEQWRREGGGEGAEHCAALATLGLGETEQAAEALEAVANRSQAGPAGRAAVYGQATQAWLLAENPVRAFAAATRALALTPDDTWLLMDRAVAAAAQGRHAEALADLDRATRLEPARGEAWVLRAATLRQLDRVELALQDIQRAIALEPENAEALLERGIIRQLRGDTEGARADWSRALELAPDSATADLAAQNLALNEAGPQRR
jgi:tetratricopeptide (TPR) repeat protein